MLKICTICRKQKEICWNDICYGENYFEIKLCYSCLKNCMPEELDFLKKCIQCGSHFIAREDWKRICFSCWKKNKKNSQSQIPIPIPVKIAGASLC